MSYNGWTNKETWLVNLWVGDLLAEMKQDGADLEEDWIEDYVCELLATDNSTVEGGFTSDLLSCAIGEVNWKEILESLEQ